MNNELQTFARNTILDGLKQCNEGQQLLFKRMYAHGNLEKSIDDTVAQLEVEKLDWAMQQIAATIKKNKAKSELEGKHGSI